MFREPSGTAALSGRDLPADETLAAFAHVNARAQVYKASGAFPEEGMDRLRATAYLDILNEIAAEDRIAYGRLSPHDAPDRDDVPDAPDAGADLDGDGMDDAPDIPDDAAGLGGSGCPCDECDGRCAPPDDSPFPDDGPRRDRATADRATADRATAGRATTDRAAVALVVPATGAREAAASYPLPAAPVTTPGQAPAATRDQPRRPRDRRSCGPPTGPRRP